MIRIDVKYILEICSEIDSLVTHDAGSASVEVLERLRLQMNDMLLKKRWKKAEAVAYRILLLWQGNPAEAESLDELDDQ